ncbi:MAG: rhomboid family intramembrane serine protease [Polyangiaceae bacterium]
MNGVGFDRCVRCAAPLGSAAKGAEALRGTVDGAQLWGTKVILGLTLLVFAGQLATMLRSGSAKNLLMSGGTRAELLQFGAMVISLDHVTAEPYRLLSAVFVHIGVLHVVMNMLGLGSVGRVLEPAVGSARFVVGYLVCGVLGFATNVAVELVFPHRGPVPVLTAGASGAVFGAMGMVLGWLIQRRDRRWRSFAVQIVFFAVVVNLMGFSVNNGAHLGGLGVGVGLGFFFAWRPPPRSALWANVGAIVGLVLSVASLLLAQRAAARGHAALSGAGDAGGAAQEIAAPAPGGVRSVVSGQAVIAPPRSPSKPHPRRIHARAALLASSAPARWRSPSVFQETP